MNFAFSDEQVLLRDTARTLLANECPSTLVRAHMDDRTAADPLWAHERAFAALGDGACTDLAIFAEETGYVAAPGPFFATTALFAPLLGAIGHPLLDDVLAGSVTGTVALAGASGEWVTNGDPVKTFVPEADRVDWIAVVDRGASVRLVTPADATLREVSTLDTTRPVFEVEVTATGGEPFAVTEDAVAAVVQRATVALAAELVGTARRMFDMTLAYVKERHQFGVPIGSFQAVQHKLADVSLGVERAQSAAQYAAMALDADDPDRHRAVHVAKAAAGEAATRAAKDGIQLHGGIGYTWEHDLHLFIRRAYASEHWMGNTAWHHDRLADLLFT
ncbi:MAG: acyl-CoA dehydrogenase family protein [Acidimicrobiia bacterium]